MRFLLFILMLILLPFGSYSQEAMTLEDCIQYGLKNSPDMRIGELQLKDAEFQIQENKATGLPNITASLSLQRFLQAPALPAEALGIPAPPGEKLQFTLDHQFSGTIQATQLIFSNSYLTALKAARFYREYVSAEMETKKRTLRNSVTDAYLPALLLSENVKILENNIKNLQRLLTETQEIQKAGFAEQLDVDRLSLSLSTLTDEQQNILRQKEMVINALKFTMHYPIDQDLTLEDDLEKLLADNANVSLDGEINYNARADYRQLLRGRELSALNTNLYTKTWMPTVSAFAAYSPSFQGNDKLFWVPSALVGLNISIPIYDFGGTKAKKERSILSTQQIDIQREMLESAIQLEVTNARKQYENAKNRVSNQEKNLDLAQRIYDTTQIKYKAGVGSSLEMISAEQSLYEAQQSLMNAQYALLEAQTAIKKALN